MLPSLRAAACILLTTAACAHGAETQYAGTFGSRRVTLRIDTESETVRSAQYGYVGQKDTVRIVDSRIFGTTAVLQDEDGNILHLHLHAADGSGTSDWSAATSLEGSMERGDLDLPVRLLRSPSTAR